MRPRWQLLNSSWLCRLKSLLSLCRTDNRIVKVPSQSRIAPSHPPLLKKAVLHRVPEGAKIEDLLNGGQERWRLSRLWLAQIEICAHKKQFDMAEQLREWLIQADSTSLREIIRAAEIIEEQKNAAISDEYRCCLEQAGRGAVN